MPKPLKWFSNGRGYNFLPDFMERLPNGSRPLTSDPLPYNSTNNTVVFWRYYDRKTVEDRIKDFRNVGINNLRFWVNYYAWKYHNDRNSSYFLDNLNHLCATLDKYGMHSIWSLFDSLIVSGNAPTPGAEYDDNGGWKYFPSAPLAQNSNFFELSGRQYLSSVIGIISGYQSPIAYELSNELTFNHFPSGNVIKGLSSIREFDVTPSSHRKVSPGFVTYVPWHNVGTSPQSTQATQQWHSTTGYGTLITPHPYMPFPSIRSIVVDLDLSAGYDMNLPMFFTEGAFTTDNDPHIKFYQWCATSGLGWNIYQGFSPNVSGVLYAGIVGMLHPDGEVRLSGQYNYIKEQAIENGYKESWLENLRIKSYTDANGDFKSDVFVAPQGSLLYPFKRYSLTFSSNPYLNHERLFVDGERTIDHALEYVQNYSVSSTDLSAIRANYGSEGAATQELNGEYLNQRQSLKQFIYLGVGTALGYGITDLAISSLFQSKYGINLTLAEQNELATSAAYWTQVELPGCHTAPYTTCLYGPGHSGGGVCLPINGDCFDYDAYTSWHQRVRTYFCGLLPKFGLGSCSDPV